MPLNPTALRAQLADRVQHPIVTTGDPTKAGSPGLFISINLIFQGVAYKPEDIFDALEAKYGVGKISSDRDSLHRAGPLHFRVIT